jgi:hypothetical protein
MAFWLEIHCDVRSDGPPDPGRLDPFCWSEHGASPGILVSNGHLMTGRRMLERDAVNDGWKKSKRGWECPACKQVELV